MLIGRHVKMEIPLEEVANYAHEIGCQIFQIFITPGNKYLYKPISSSTTEMLRQEIMDHKLKLVIHGHYTINLSNPSGSTGGTGAVITLINNLKAAMEIGENCLGVVVHMGQNTKKHNISYQNAFDNYVINLKKAINKTSKSCIILETGASQGNEVGSSVEEMAQIYHALTKSEKQRIKFCVDTCHIWATGYDISDQKGVDAYFDLFSRHIGIQKIACIHFNNSKNKLGSHIDCHADLLTGMIPVSGIEAVIKVAYYHQIPLLLETPMEIDYDGNKITFSDEKKFIKSVIQSIKKSSK